MNSQNLHIINNCKEINQYTGKRVYIYNDKYHLQYMGVLKSANFYNNRYNVPQIELFFDKNGYYLDKLNVNKYAVLLE